VFTAVLFFTIISCGLRTNKGDDFMHLHFQDLSKSYNGKAIFENINGDINGADKIGLVGLNGIGKTTLARLIAGKETGDAGIIEYAPSHLRIL